MPRTVEVGGGATADGHDRVGPGEAGLAQSVPAVRRCGGGLRRFSVGDREVEHLVRRERTEHLAYRLVQGLRVDDRDASRAGAEGRRQPRAQVVADDDVVAAAGVRRVVDAEDGLSHRSPPAAG
jgi:hypothetical protein